jgi:hypothetical protein
MTNAHYRSGVYYERKALADLRRLGYCAIRSAGSHGIFDIVAISGERVLLIQVKSGGASLSKSDRDAWRALKLPPCAQYQIWHYRKGVNAPMITELACE